MVNSNYFDDKLIDSSTSSDEIIIILNDVTSKVKVDSDQRSYSEYEMLEENLKRDFLSYLHNIKNAY